MYNQVQTNIQASDPLRTIGQEFQKKTYRRCPMSYIWPSKPIPTSRTSRSQKGKKREGKERENRSLGVHTRRLVP